MQLLGAYPQAITVSAYKRAVHIMPDQSDDDTLLEGYLRAAQMTVEKATRRPMLPRSARFATRVAGWRRWWLPMCPVSAITAVRWQDEDGQWVTLDATAVRLETGEEEPQVVVPDGYWSAASDGAPVAVDATAGLIDVDHTHPLGQAVILLARDWYLAGVALEKIDVTNVTFGARSLMKQWRYQRPREFAAR